MFFVVVRKIILYQGLILIVIVENWVNFLWGDPATVDILAALKRTAIPKPHDLSFCLFPKGFFAPALTDLLCSGHQVALQTDTASPAAKMFLLALISRSWCVPQSGQSHSRTFNGIFSAIYPQLLHLLELGNHLSISM